jgi:hypothetical protein
MANSNLFFNKEDRIIINNAIALARKDYLGKIKIYLLIASFLLFAGRLLGPLMAASGIEIVGTAIQGGCLALVFYAIIMPKSNAFLKFRLSEEIITELNKTLPTEVWQTILKEKNMRGLPYLCVADILSDSE